MPLSKFLSPLKQLLPCILCQDSRSSRNGVCEACWATLPWKKQYIHRHDIDCFVSCHYAFPIDQVLHQYKDQQQFAFSNLLVACLLEMPKPRIQAIVPMPMSTEKLIKRGFHQTYRLAQILAKAWQLPIWQPVSRHDGHSQRGLQRAERLYNLQDQFYLNSDDCRYHHVLMLDDVITTGASLHQLQQQLQHLGCRQIYALCLCDAAH